VIQGVQHVVYPPERLAAWPDGPGQSRLVFIARDLTQCAIERSLKSVLGVIAQSVAPEPAA
jgi:G3E family GTPase